MAVASPAEKLGQDLDKRLKNNRNVLWEKQIHFLIKKIHSHMEFNLLKFFIYLKALGKILTGIMTC